MWVAAPFGVGGMLTKTENVDTCGHVFYRSQAAIAATGSADDAAASDDLAAENNVGFLLRCGCLSDQNTENGTHSSSSCCTFTVLTENGAHFH
jgi:hypothetical protein